jgi:hypothetical protein
MEILYLIVVAALLEFVSINMGSVTLMASSLLTRLVLTKFIALSSLDIFLFNHLSVGCSLVVSVLHEDALYTNTENRFRYCDILILLTRPLIKPKMRNFVADRDPSK